MALAGRLGDRALFASGGVGPAVTGSANVLIHNRAALRIGDRGIYPSGTWEAISGSATILINGRAAHRLMDSCKGSTGKTAESGPFVDMGNLPGKARPDVAVKVEIAQVDGLYMPSNEGQDATERSRKVVGYKSSDGRGRVYLNNDYNRKWKANNQQIRLKAKVKITRGSLPADAVLRWIVTFTNKVGTFDKTPPWEEVIGYALKMGSDAQADTSIAKFESQVILHCLNTAGAKFSVHVFVHSKVPIEVESDATGTITMWHRINVKYIAVPGALELPIAQIPKSFEPAFIQMDFPSEKADIGKPLDREKLFTKKGLKETSEYFYEYYKSIVEKFLGKDRQGWLLLIAELDSIVSFVEGEQTSLPNIELGYDPSVPLGSDPSSRREPREYIDVRSGLEKKVGELVEDKLGKVAGENAAVLVGGIAGEVKVAGVVVGEVAGKRQGALGAKWAKITDNRGYEARFLISLSMPLGEITRYYLDPHDMHPDFVAGQSREEMNRKALLFSPRYRLDKGVRGGFGMPDNVSVTIGPIPVTPDGVTPWHRPDPDKDSYYQLGMSLVFTTAKRREDERPSDFRRTATHELAHALGVPHKCGRRAARGNGGCLMNYPSHWLLKNDFEYDSNAREPPGYDFCEIHITALRDTHFEEHKGLKWAP